MDTPWGHSGELQTRRLKPGPGASRKTAERNQRERLLGAAVAVISTQGYRTARVADLLAVSGVSRSAFYRLYSDKQDCLLAAVDAIAEAAGVAVTDALRDSGTWEQRVRAALDALIGLVVAQPAAARLCFVEVHAAGPEAVELVERQARRIGRLISDALEECPERRGMPNDVIRAVLGGVRKVIQTRLRLGREGELTELTPVLVDWAASYTAPSEELRRGVLPERLVIEDGTGPPRERALRALTALVAEQGYHDVAITEIAARASMSLTTFYSEFDGKEDAFLAALDRVEGLLLEAAVPAYDAAADWPDGVREGLRAFYGVLSADTDLAWLGTAAAWTAGPESLDRLDGMIERFHPLLHGGYARRPEVDPLVVEAIGASIAALIYDHLMRKGASDLHEAAPVAAFVALAPFLGSAEATAVVNRCSG